jgi:hypothetical protein
LVHHFNFELQNMKKITTLILICILSFQMAFPAINLREKDKVYYWFYIKLGTTTDKKTNSAKLLIKKISTEIESGKYEEFIKRHKEGLKTRTVFIGPFAEKIQAEKAMIYYLASKNRPSTIGDPAVKSINDTTFYYYLTRPIMPKLFNPLSFQRVPARISNGTQGDYLSMLEEGLSFQFLAIGPFMDYGLAEKSKFIFRKNGERTGFDTTQTIKPTNLSDMAKGWKSIKIEMIKQNKKKIKDKIVYQLKIKFPKSYFIEDAFQSITIKPKYSDSTITSNYGLTFQGDYVMDNNDIIPFDKITTYNQSLSFNVYKKVKLQGFYIESLIFNSTEMIDQEIKFVVAK